MTHEEIARLIAAMRFHGVTRLELSQPRKGLQLCLTLADAPPQHQPPATQRRRAVLSPGIGLWVPLGRGDGTSSPAVGARIRAGDPLGHVAQGAVLQIVAAPCDGRLASALPTAGHACGLGDQLAEVEDPGA